MSAEPSSVVSGRGLRKAFEVHGRTIAALDGVDFRAAAGAMTALVGSDGAGKTTLMRLIAGLLAPDAGELTVLGLDLAADPEGVQARIGYMPQRFGLYEDLTVQENLDLYADLHAVPAEARARKYPELMEMTALGPFRRRLAGALSGGMKQKLGLACTLVSTPELLLLDEPTAGVDPLSRRELWQIMEGLVRDGMPIVISTSYLDEAERCAEVLVLHGGKVLASGAPADISARVQDRALLVTPHAGVTPRALQAELLARPYVIDAVPETGKVRVVLGAEEGARARLEQEAEAQAVEPAPAGFEDVFMTLLRAQAAEQTAQDLGAAAAVKRSASPARAGDKVEVRVEGLTRRFGAFTAVDNIGFEVGAGEVFGLLGPNGAGKTTTFRMLCGLLPATGGQLFVGGADMRRARASARSKIGYVAQKFSLYGILSVVENLDFFASVYGLRGGRKRERIAWALDQFALGPFAHAPSAQLAGGYKQRLAMAAALLHEPEILFLDEPTSGADPLARREFWRRITALADQGVTVIVTTHFMAEAEYCDRIAILDSGRILAQGRPDEVRARAVTEARPEPDMEDAFVAIVDASRAAGKAAA
jgi:ABC-2 type transport system ATP-binding protein